VTHLLSGKVGPDITADNVMVNGEGRVRGDVDEPVRSRRDIVVALALSSRLGQHKCGVAHVR
jgi:hypothetical protein